VLLAGASLPPECLVVVRLPTVEVCAGEVGGAVPVLRAGEDLTLVKADTSKHIPPVMVTVAITILSIPSFILQQALTVRPSLAASESPHLTPPRIAHVLEASVIRIPLPGYCLTIIISHAHRKLSKDPERFPDKVSTAHIIVLSIVTETIQKESFLQWL